MANHYRTTHCNRRKAVGKKLSLDSPDNDIVSAYSFLSLRINMS